MGRRKITIKQISDPKLRHITFNKRRNGLIKKACELSVLCNVNMLLIFEDGNGNLIQFSRNKITSIPGFFQECRYSNVAELTVKDYPNFFKVNHYKKGKERDQQDEIYTENLDVDLDSIVNHSFNDDFGSKPVISDKKQKFSGSYRLKKEDSDSSHIIYQSGSEESSHDAAFDEMSPHQEFTTNETNVVEQQKKSQIKIVRPVIQNPPVENQQQQKTISNEKDNNMTFLNEQPMPPTAHKEIFQPYKDITPRVREEKPANYPPPQFMNYDQGFKRPIANDQGNSSFRFYPAESTNNINIPSNNNFINPINTGFVNGHPYMGNNIEPMNAPSGYPNTNKNNRLRAFNMGNMPNDDPRNMMYKGFAPMGFAAFGGHPFIAQPTPKPEMDEKLIETANMIKYLNGTGAASYVGPKKYGFHPAEAGKYDDHDHMAHLRSRNEFEGASYGHGNDYYEVGPYARNEFRHEPSLPANLPSAYFSSKKFNFDGYANNFEDDRFNEFVDAKKKLKQ